MNFDPNTGEPVNNVQQPANQPKKSNGLAIAGFILALVGGFLLDIVGLILSIVGLNKAKECNSGKGLAIAGIIIAIVKMVLGIIIIIACWGLILGLLGIAIEYQEYCTKPETVCSAVVDGFAECKYKEGSVTYTISCPSDLINNKTTEPTTKEITTKGSGSSLTKLTGAKEYKLDDDTGAAYYADVFYFINNNVYAHLTSNAPKSIKSTDNVNGVDTTLVVKNVVDVFVVEYGQAGYQKVIIVDGLGDAYEILNLDSKGQELYIKKYDAKNVKKAYSLGVNDAVDYILVNDKNQIINPDTNHLYAYYDKKNGLNETLIGSDVIKIVFSKSEKDAKDKNFTHNYFDVYINGTKQDKQADFYVCDDVDAYEDIDLVTIAIKKSGNKYTY